MGLDGSTSSLCVVSSGLRVRDALAPQPRKRLEQQEASHSWCCNHNMRLSTNMPLSHPSSPCTLTFLASAPTTPPTTPPTHLQGQVAAHDNISPHEYQQERGVGTEDEVTAGVGGLTGHIHNNVLPPARQVRSAALSLAGWLRVVAHPWRGRPGVTAQ